MKKKTARMRISVTNIVVIEVTEAPILTDACISSEIFLMIISFLIILPAIAIPTNRKESFVIPAMFIFLILKDNGNLKR